MSTYVITASVDTVSMKTNDDSVWSGSVEIPPFRVTADSKDEAAQTAREIVDPLDMTGVNITAVEELPSESAALAQLNADLDKMAGAVLTPYEHYCAAERLLAEAEKLTDAFAARVHVRAQIHATLASAIIPERGAL
jgi:hypothetical protein